MLPRSYDSSSLAILVVDDEPAILQVMMAYFCADGHAVGAASNGVDALAQFNSGTWDVVITDRVMAEMDGETLAAEIKRRSPRTPVIMVTGSRPRERPAGVDVLIDKPFTREVLVRAISKCLGELPDEPSAEPA